MIYKRITLEELISFLGDEILFVDGNINGMYIDNLADVQHVNERTLDWVNPSKKDKQQIAEHSRAKVILVDESIVSIPSKILIHVRNPKTALAKVGNNYFVERPKPGIHPTAIVDDNAEIGEGVYIGPYCVIGKVNIGNRCVISSHACILDNVSIGEDCFIKEGVVIGGAGFGFEKDTNGDYFRFPQIGGVKIGNNVEIGANTCIDRGALSDTIIRDSVKISNLCQIAHNVQIGENTIITACVEISGSCIVGDNVWIGPNCSVRDQRIIGKNSLIGLGAVVTKNIPECEVWAGCPANYLRKKSL